MKRTVVRKGRQVVQRAGAKKTARPELATDFSVVEDSSRAVSIMRRIGANAGRKAIAAARAAGASTAYMKNNKEFIKVDATGKATAIQPVFKRSSYYVTIKPGTKFNASKK